MTQTQDKKINTPATEARLMGGGKSRKSAPAAGIPPNGDFHNSSQLGTLLSFLTKSVFSTKGQEKNLGGFTLIELLVVIAITGVLVSLLFIPLLKSFEITQKAQVTVQVQEAARQTLEQLTREIQSAVFVYDNSRDSIFIPIPASLNPPNSSYGPGFLLAYGKLDLVPPRSMMHCNSSGHPAGQPRDFSLDDGFGNRLAWRNCPYDGSSEVEMRPITPIEPDRVIVRYFIGLKDPEREYSNRNENVFSLAGDADNTFVLYRAEFNPFDPNLIDNSNGDGLKRPDFFYNTNTAPNGRTFSQNWRAISKPVGPIKDVDLIALTFDSSGSAVSAVTSAIQFVPSAVKNDVMTPVDARREGDTDPGAPPTVFRASAGQWGSQFEVRLFRKDLSEVFYTAYDDVKNLVIYKYGSSAPVFNITAFQERRELIPSEPELMFNVDPNKGEVSFSFPFSQTFQTSDIRKMNAEYKKAYETDGAALRMLTLDGFADWKSKVPSLRLVAGSERIVGPDWNPGANFGKKTEYSRVASLTDDPGPNQYKIDYQTGEIVFYSLPHPPMPESGSVSVSYSIQCNQNFNTAEGDILTADYSSKNMMSVQVAYRIYDPTGKSQIMRLANNVLVRNFHR